MRRINEKIKFWNKRAKLRDLAGTNDFMLRELERLQIMKIVKPGSRVLDIGCGDGSILIELAKRKKCTGFGIDFAPQMIVLAKSKNRSGKIDFIVGDMRSCLEGLGQFDYIISKRSLCNLNSAKEQSIVFAKILSLLKKGGRYLMIEDFQDGLDKVNALREGLGLYKIEMPWHNLFLKESAVKLWAPKGYWLEKIIQLSGTYYFLSRVVYAKLNEGKKLRYDSEINKISLRLPQELTDVCVTKLYLWEKLRGQVSSR